MVSAFLQASYRERLCEDFPLNRVVHLVLGQAPKCWHSLWKGVPVLSLLLTPSLLLLPLLRALPQIGKNCAQLPENHTFPTCLGYHPQAYHMPQPPGKRLCLELGNTHFLKVPLSNVHGANQIGWGRFSKFSAHLAPEQEQMGSHLKCQCCIPVIYLKAQEFSKPQYCEALYRGLEPEVEAPILNSAGYFLHDKICQDTADPCYSECDPGTNT